MAIVEEITYNLGTYKEFDLIIKGKNSQIPKDLSAFVGASGDSLKLMLPGEDGMVALTLDDSVNGVLSIADASSALAGRIHVIFKDPIPLKGDDCAQTMELTIVEGTDPNLKPSRVKFPHRLVVCATSFD